MTDEPSHLTGKETAEQLRRLLTTAPGALSRLKGHASELDPPAHSSLSLTMDGLLRLAPMGMVIIDQHFEILSFNRAAYKLLGLQLYEEQASDFFHATRGLPYHEVRTAIETVLREGSSHTLPLVELSAGEGGSGRILSMTICALPSEIGTQSNVVLYLLDVTEHNMLQQQHIVLQHLQHRQAQEHAQLQYQYEELSQTCERLQQTSTRLLLEYQRLALQHEQTKEAYQLLEQQVEQLQEELTVLIEEQSLDRDF